jgi:hypothetical protein
MKKDPAIARTRADSRAELERRINERAAEVRAELARLGDAEFTRRYYTGPRKPFTFFKA